MGTSPEYDEIRNSLMTALKVAVEKKIFSQDEVYEQFEAMLLKPQGDTETHAFADLDTDTDASNRMRGFRVFDPKIDTQ